MLKTKQREDEEMKLEFKAVLLLIMKLLKLGQVQEVIETIEEILK